MSHYNGFVFQFDFKYSTRQTFNDNTIQLNSGSHGVRGGFGLSSRLFLLAVLFSSSTTAGTANAHLRLRDRADGRCGSERGRGKERRGSGKCRYLEQRLKMHVGFWSSEFGQS